MINPFSKSWVRHITAGVLIIGICLGVGFWWGSVGKAELKGELTAVIDEVNTLRETVTHIAKAPKIQVSNDIRGVKVKDGAQLNFTPETEIEQHNIRDPAPIQNPNIEPLNSDSLLIQMLQLELNDLVQKDKKKGRQNRLKRKIKRIRSK